MSVLTEGREGREAGRRADEENYFPPDDLIFSPRRHRGHRDWRTGAKSRRCGARNLTPATSGKVSPPGGPEGGFWLQIVPSPILPRFFIFKSSQAAFFERLQTRVSCCIHRLWDDLKRVKIASQEIHENSRKAYNYRGLRRFFWSQRYEKWLLWDDLKTRFRPVSTGLGTI